MNREIPIFFTIDDGYAPFLAVALNSAIKNCDTNKQYKAIVLHQELNDANKAKLRALETDNFKIELTPMKANFEALDDRMSILLMNLKKMRECDLEGHFLRLLNTYHFDCIAPDQDYLNAMCNGKIYYLDAAWDAMPNDAKPPLAKTNLIHYNLFSKPWCYDGVQYESEFWEYAEDSGYIDEIKAYKAAYTDDKKKADSECLNLLVRRGEEIPENDITFKKLKEKGVKISL